MADIEDDYWKMVHWVIEKDRPQTADKTWGDWKSLPAEKIKFENYEQVLFAAMLLKSDKLPPAARLAIGDLLFKVVGEALDKGFTIECMGIYHKRGRKKDLKSKAEIVYSVARSIHEGLSKTEAYEQVAMEKHKSPDTIRRLYERVEKEYKSRIREN